MFAVKSPHRVDRVEDVGRGAVHRRFGERRQKSRMIGAGQRHHRVAMNEWRQFAPCFMRRPRRRNEINRVQMKSPLRRLRHRDVARVDRDRTCLRKARPNGDAVCRTAYARTWMSTLLPMERSSVIFSVAIFVTGDGPIPQSRGRSRTAPRRLQTAGSGFGIRSSALAMARTSSTIPSPVADEIA